MKFPQFKTLQHRHMNAAEVRKIASNYDKDRSGKGL
ncbi:hypothetical protein PaVLD_ORF141L [Planktothrix phage PaV-LD]|nr:hypothetical protein PaVLD_ORF141L [Planktothrix phage PaV-LD]ADZ31648.1 hypothetical protein PaVLD_ORF141L [Planktothrix phage PaV-LD]